jgi:hypothetical protein
MTDKDNLVRGSPPITSSIWDELKSKLSPETVAKIESRKVLELSGPDFEVKFLGSRGNLDKLAEMITEYSNGLQIVGNFQPGVSIELMGGEMMYTSYIAFTPASARIIDKLIKLEHKEQYD